MTTKIQDDLYEAVNGEWIASAEIPADKPATGGFNQLVEENEKLLLDDFAPMLSGEIEAPTNDLKEFIKFYKKASDFTTRNAEGVEPIRRYLKKIEDLKSFDDFKADLAEWILESYPTPFSFSVSEDMKDTDKNTLWVSGPSLILPDPTYYEEDNPQREALLQAYSEMVLKLLNLAGVEEEKAKRLLERTLAFDKSLVPFVNTSEENALVENIYNPKSFDEVVTTMSNIPVKEMITKLTGVTPKSAIVAEPRFFENFNNLVSDKTFGNIKAWLYVNTLRGFGSYLSEEYRQVAGSYSRTLSGVDEARPQDKHAFDLASGTFSEVVGNYYGLKYFGEEAKKDVERMVSKMIEVYKSRLAENDWLTPETRDKAIVKLDNLGVFIGYPDHIQEIFHKFIVDEDKSLVENTMKFSRLLKEREYSEYSLPVDKTRWHMPAHQVNAYFMPTANHIVFPAAILQKPFYSIEQSSSQNYGGIGAVIAHEISHAFDNNGSQFDERGNLNDWWTDSDREKFKIKQQEMIDEFDGVETEAGKTNGTLIVSENIADVGGVNAALTAAKTEKDVDLQDFFINWATIWRTKARKEYMQLLLSIDVHAPAKLRANIQASNFQEFYDVFDVKESDGMYRAPEKRVIIW
ncbi:MAG: M13 family peptidase [Lactobacillales bacterium]|jgi:putative endopeptidase|nr:M13 family peptidase [Lactobacillales bacterium]